MKTALFAMAALAVARTAQGPLAQTAAPAAANLELTVNRFFQTASHYEQTFRNLTVEETKVIEELDESGRVRKHREIARSI